MTPEDSTYYTHPNIIASVQPTHATSDMYWAEERLGHERIHHAYSYLRIFNAAGDRGFWTDFPIEHIDPLATFFAATTRQDANHWPENGFLPEQCVSPGLAISAMTHGAAYSAFGEDIYGSIYWAKCKLHRSQSKFMAPDTPLRQNTKVIRTIVNGVSLYTEDQ